MKKWYLLSVVMAVFVARRVYINKKRHLAATRSQPEPVDNPDINRGRHGDTSLYDRTVPVSLL